MRRIELAEKGIDVLAVGNRTVLVPAATTRTSPLFRWILAAGRRLVVQFLGALLVGLATLVPQSASSSSLAHV